MDCSNSTGSPPRGRRSLGQRLAFLTTLIVTGTMAALTGVQLWFDLREDVSDHEERLQESLAPLIVELEGARTIGAARESLMDFHAAYANRGHVDHQIAIKDLEGRTLMATGTGPVRETRNLLTAAVPIVAPALGPGNLALLAWANSDSILDARDRRLKAWVIHVGFTAMLTVALMLSMIRHEVTRPIERLLEGVRKMELGYWDEMPDPGGAWEIRWLGWRFRALGQELSSTVERLVAAQRRAFATEVGRAETDVEPQGPVSVNGRDTVVHAGAILARLQGRLARLRVADAQCPADRTLAQLVWDSEAILAERLGRPDLSAALEDAALKILDPQGFAEVCATIDRARPELENIARLRQSEIEREATARGVRLIDVQWRIKHAAGVWRKMQWKQLRVEQVHDLVALRVIVPAEADCYHALGVVHDLYRPVVGRFKDYIAAPKSNGYRGLHCSVRGGDDAMFEVQIRSMAMHNHAEGGDGSHVHYRAAHRLQPNVQDRSTWRRILHLVSARPHGEMNGP